MKNYKIIYRKQDIGLRLSSLYRQRQLAIGILDFAGRSELIDTLSWYNANMNSSIHVLTTEYRMEDNQDLIEKFPDATFIVLKDETSTGEFINAFADECDATFFLVVRTDLSIIAFEGEKLMALMSNKNHPAVISPVMISSQGEVMPTLRAPFIRGKEVDPQSFMPNIESEKPEMNLYPLLEIGLYDRALFQRLRAYDVNIMGEFYQSLDFGVRCHLFGYSIVTVRMLAVQFPNRISIIENRSECDGMNRFYTKALSIRRIAGKNIIEKWKPYVDKEVLQEEVKKKQINIQKTDFFTLQKNWKV
mgnify:FL=1